MKHSNDKYSINPPHNLRKSLCAPHLYCLCCFPRNENHPEFWINHSLFRSVVLKITYICMPS